MLRVALLVLIFATALGGVGCSILAKETPTPAAKVRSADLLHTPSPPTEQYYLILFGSQDRARNPAFTHTWATLVKTTETPGCSEPAVAEYTISWLPAKIDIDPSNFRVEPGANVGLHETIANSLRTNQEIAMWGPYEVWHGFAHRFLVQKAFLESGAIGYQCIDVIGEAAREGNGCDCIHAITDMDPNLPRWRYPLAFYGQPATANAVRRIMHAPVTVGAPATHDWIIPRLGLDRYPIDRRDYHGRVEPFSPEGIMKASERQDRRTRRN